MASTQRFKIVLLGEGRVGKTSILLRYIRGEYDDRQVSTLQASYLDKKVVIGDTTAQLSVWDTAGQERYHALGPIYYRDADGALLVYDITDAESFNKVKAWVKELKKILGNDIAVAIAGNKIDMEKNRNVNQQEAIEYAASVGAKHFHTSAKANRGIDEVFNDLATRMIDERKKKTKGGAAGGAGTKQRLVIVDDVQPAEQKSSGGGCC